MLRLKPLGAAVLLLGLSQAAWSMDLLQAWQTALQRDPNILASRAANASRQERVPQAYAQLLPNVSANFGRNKNDLRTIQPGLLGSVSDTRERYFSSNQTLSVRQPIYRPFQSAQYRQSKAQADDASAQLERDTQNVAVRIGGAYFEALLAVDQLALIGSQKASVTTQLDAASKALAGGAGTRTDVDEARARLDLVLAQELEAKQNLDFTRRQLEILLGETAGELAAVDPDKLELVPPDPALLDEWIARAEENSPEGRALLAQVEAARHEVDKAKSGHLPTLDAVAQRSKSESENVTRVSSTFDNTSFGFQLSIPLYAGGGVTSQVRQAIAEQDRAEQALEAGKRDLAIRVQREFRGVTEGILKIRAYEQAVKSAELLVTSSRRSLQAGSRTIIDVLNAEQQRTLAARDLAQSRYLYLISRIRLLALVGDVDLARMSQINGWLGTLQPLAANQVE